MDEPSSEKTNDLGFQPGLTQTSLCSYRRWLETLNFRFKKKSDCSIHVAKTKSLMSFTVSAKLISFVFAHAFCLFSYVAAQLRCPL